MTRSAVRAWRAAPTAFVAAAAFAALNASFAFAVPPPPARAVPVSQRSAPVPHAGAPALGMPVPGVDPARLVDSFHQKRGARCHEAIDIAAARGTPVVAVADGRVAKLFHSVPGGLTVYQFDTTGGLVFYYAHLESYADGLREGALLRRGDAVGRVGSSGNADPGAPHLHFAVFELGPERQWWRGTALNPYPLLTGRPGTAAPCR